MADYMRIGFDAKRLFFNKSGLGNYSRSTVELLHTYSPQNGYVLLSPKEGNPCGFELADDITVDYPSGLFAKMPSLWRSYAMSGSIRKHNLDIYHGLSNELPSDIRKAGVKSIVTMHDLIFVRYPELYKPLDRRIYVNKYRKSCTDADRIIAISKQTKDDLVNFWDIKPEKIDVVYQGCNPMFYRKVSESDKKRIKELYELPERYLLSVGSIEERKNLLLTVKAMAKGDIDIDLVACGKYTPYVDTIMRYATKHGIAHRVKLIHNVNFTDLPTIYQMSCAVVYVSIFEGFGIPILEALNSGVPVITTIGGVFPETGGNAAIYVDPQNVDQMIDAIDVAMNDPKIREEAITRGYIHSALFKEEHIADKLNEVYHSIL